MTCVCVCGGMSCNDVLGVKHPIFTSDKLTRGPAEHVHNLGFAVLATGKNPGIVMKDDFKRASMFCWWPLRLEGGIGICFI